MRFPSPVEPLRLRRVPLAAAALCFAAGILLERVVAPPTPVLLGAMLLLAGLLLLALGRAIRVAWLPAAAGWVVLGVAAAAWQPAAAVPVQLQGFADNLSRTVEGRVTRVRMLPPRPADGVQADADPVPPWEMTEIPESSRDPQKQGQAQEQEQALSLDLAVERVELVTPDTSEMVAAEGGVRVTVYAQPGELGGLGCGDQVEMPLRMRLPDVYRDPGAFDDAAYLLAHDGIAARGYVAADRVRRLQGTPAGLAETVNCRLHQAQGWAAGRLQQLVTAPSNRLLPPALRLASSDAAMLSAMLFGDRSGLSQNLRVSFERTGTFHLFVVSGLHVALMAGALFWLFSRLRLPGWAATAAAVGGATAYAALTGFGQPAQRALAMTSMYLLARLFSRTSDPLNALGAATLAMLIWSPSSLFGASLQMTVLVILAIGGLAVPLNRWLFLHWQQGARDAWRHPRQSFHPAEAQLRFRLELWGEALAGAAGSWALRLPANLLRLGLAIAELALLGLVTELVLALPVAIYFHRAAVFALPANMLVLPVVGVLAALAVSTFAAALISPWLALVPAAATAGLLHTVTWAIGRLGHAPSADVRVPGPQLALAAVAVVLWLAACWAVRRGRWGAWATALALPAIALLVLWPEPAVRTPGALELTAIDVGQGDCLLAVGPAGETMLIDAGGPIGSHGEGEIVSNFDVGEQLVSPYLWSRRLRRLDVVVLSHAHTDHMGGMPAVLENFRPRELWVGIDPGSRLYSALLVQARRLGVKVRHLHAGDRPAWGGTQVEVLAPAAAYRNAGAPRNDDSLVLRLQMGQASVLLEGDAERPSEDAMLAAGRVSPVTLLKVGHHGSRTSSNPEFVAAAQPREAVISDGRHNPFGHPYPDVVERFAARGTRLFRTDEFGLTTFLLRPDGSVAVTADGMPLPAAALSPGQAGQIGQAEQIERR